MCSLIICWSLPTLLAIYFVIIYAILSDRLCENIGLWLFVNAMSFFAVYPIAIICGCCSSFCKKSWVHKLCAIFVVCFILFVIVWHFIGCVWTFEANKTLEGVCSPVIYWTGFVWCILGCIFYSIGLLASCILLCVAPYVLDIFSMFIPE